MQSDETQVPPAKVEMCANRFELVSGWQQPLDKDWARQMFETWLAQRDGLDKLQRL